MKDHEFYHTYANMPLLKRGQLISNDYTNPALGMTAHDIYLEVKKIDDKIRPDIIRKQHLIREFEKYINL